MGASVMFTLLAGVSGAQEPNLFTSVLLHDPDPTGARCLDGTPPRIWVHKSQSTNPANRTKWAWHFQGGGWCESEEACTERAFAKTKCMLGSSREECFNDNSNNVAPFAPVMDLLHLPAVNGARWGGGLLNNSAGTNPLSHDWNKVVMFYCDGGSYSGNNGTAVAVTYDGTARHIHYRGARNLDFALATLASDWGMANATDVLISGDSAGGLASYWHADRFAAVLPEAFVATVPDSGFFIGDATKPEWPASLEWIVSAMNSTAGLDASCVAAAQASGKTPGQACTLPEDVAPHIQVPLFAMNSKYDPAMISISSKALTAEEINALATRFVAKVNAAVVGPGQRKNGAFITGCHEHCGQWAQGQKAGKNSDFNATIDGTTAPFAVQRWFATNKLGAQTDAREFVHMATAQYPCANCCDGGDGP
eukprot:Hpha_TRINITY_DN19675_c0_g1::TRINITY_DN19675_c0_g1_i1::g.186252::m.186252/K19882/NOTUM; O-palmitoleoyl-L-serine hydrolase